MCIRDRFPPIPPAAVFPVVRAHADDEPLSEAALFDDLSMSSRSGARERGGSVSSHSPHLAPDFNDTFSADATVQASS
eukprot:12479330-Alexandrium_andersonii.AAC.1